MKNTLAIFAVALLLLWPASPATAVSIVGLGQLSGWDGSIATAINNSGEVVGYSGTVEGYPRAFVWKSGSISALALPQGDLYSVANGLNDAGQIVGTASSFVGSTYPQIWQGGSVSALPNLPGFSPGDDRAYGDAYAINNSGQIAGWSTTQLGGVATVWQGGFPTAIGPVGSVADAINASGATAGYSNSGADQAFGINDVGQIVGINSAQHAFLWGSGGGDLGTLPGGTYSQANGISNAGQVVGFASIEQVPPPIMSQPPTTGYDAFLWQNGKMIDLNTLLPAGSGWVLTDATAINSENQIVGQGLYNGQPVAFLMTVPEPGTLALGIIGAVAALVWGAVARREIRLPRLTLPGGVSFSDRK